MKGKALFLGFFILLFCPEAHVFGQEAGQDYNIVFIGNSITHGSGLPDPENQAPPVIAAAILRKSVNMGKVAISNVGRSGSTTVDWLPEKHNLFLTAEKAANSYTDPAAQLVFSISLGTNDSAVKGPNGSPVSVEDYHKNLNKIADALLSEYPSAKIIFQYPIWYSENTYNGSMYLKEGLDRLQTYFPQIDQVVKDYGRTHPGRVFSGDKKAFKYFRKHPELFQEEKGQRGIFRLHPNVAGAAVLAGYWAGAIYRKM